MNCSPLGSSVHGISQARVLEWAAFPSPGDLPNTGIEPVSPVLQEDSLLLSHQGALRDEYNAVSVLTTPGDADRSDLN